MTITPIPAFNDNYIWLMQANEQAVCVDPGEAAPVLAYLQQHRLSLHSILITHHHRDHIGGVADLQEAFPDAIIYGPEDIACVTQAMQEGDVLDVLGEPVVVWEVPGHTHNHIAYLLTIHGTAAPHVFCGDTLFSAGCGRVFCGTIEQLQHSLARFQSLPDATLFYPAHEYTASNLRFALSVEPDNQAAIAALAVATDTPTLPVTLAHEKAINPFLRLDSEQIQQQVALQGMSMINDAAVFASLRQLKNQF
ncbi:MULTISPECIES: hydroxyacylglutathione hydrolase [Vitreoscilla]|uniref:Hydroxyacylglutathione hydrolase n=1 Tax=Vitreoscilla stercoraria TaxID=61 RepID=A0ABY4ED98_VITST|nr:MULTISPECIES: hydroxyacylglutathione hydrolase [Vitreoscilla]UOO93716.1 hydroxyacylglutathione hydrolase [Vitreoscilla stercoraria]